MSGSSRGLFRAVVVMGAALAGCERPASSVEPAADERGGAAGEAAVRAPEPVEPVEPAPAGEAARAEVVAPVEAGTVPVVVEAGKEAEVKAKRRPKQEPREKCPAGSERPYPPCFYIL